MPSGTPHSPPAHGGYGARKAELRRRFRRLAGQLEGIERMVEDDRYCPDVLTQLSAAAAALDGIGYLLVREHIAHCVREGTERGEGDAYMDELIAVIRRFAGR